MKKGSGFRITPFFCWVFSARFQRFGFVFMLFPKAMSLVDLERPIGAFFLIILGLRIGFE